MTPDALRAALRLIVASAPAGKVAFGEEFLSDEASPTGSTGEATPVGYTDDAWAEPGASAPVRPATVASGSTSRQLGTSSPTPAAVLVPFVLGQPMGVLLTKRTAHLKRHAGQVSFPGGRIDPTDASPEAAALREAQEEIALDPTRVEVLGRLPDHITGTGYRITPVVGLLPPGVEYTLSPHEVESIFELPLSVLLDPNAPQRQRQHVNGRWREYWVWPHPDHFVWGATAAILMHLAQQLRQRA